MFNWRAWIIPGLATLIVLTALAVIVRGGPIEADLAERSAGIFAEDGTPWASLTLSGRDATMSGLAPSEAALDAAISAADRVWGVYTVDVSALQLMPLADPYTLEFTKSVDSVTVTGAFPGEDVRTEVLDAVRAGLGDLTLVDQTELARGAPTGFSAFAAFAGAGVASVADGSIGLEGASLTVDATALDQESFTTEVARLGEPVDGLEMASLSLRPPLADPYTWAAEGTNGGVVLTGFVPDEETREALVNAASGLGSVDDQMLLASGAPDGFASAASALLTQMSALDNPSASISVDEATLNGEAPDSATFDAANAFLSAIPDGFGSISGTVLPPIADPFTTILRMTGDSFILTGVLPDETSRAVLFDAFEAQGLTVGDETTIARGGPSQFEIATVLAGAAEAMSGLTDGVATLTGEALDISGTAPSFQSVGAAEEGFAALAAQGVSVDAAIEAGPASPFTFNASTQGAGVTLDGFVPSEGSRDQVLTDVAALFPGESVIDNLQVANGAPGGFEALVTAGLRGLGRLEGGLFSISDSDANLAGEAFYDSSADSIQSDLLAGLPDGINLSAEIGVLPPPEPVDETQCQLLFARLLADNAIRFDTGSATIDTLSFGLVDRLVRTLQSCPDARVEISGHTDSDGSDDLNQTLSEERANAVLDYVLAADVDPARVTAQGYGETDPIADNATDEGKARNRRIEFNVQREQQE
ncbi:MAG: OmpA family protein [Pseudomonadota bacterium]